MNAVVGAEHSANQFLVIYQSVCSTMLLCRPQRSSEPQSLLDGCPLLDILQGLSRESLKGLTFQTIELHTHSLILPTFFSIIN